jgi:pimeloyl-ACP methyl ester carboxylesterase
MDAARRDDVVATLTDVACPVVLVRGAHDRIAPADWLRTLVGTGPGRVVVQLPAGAHMVPLTHPELLARHVAPLLADSR